MLNVQATLYLQALEYKANSVVHSYGSMVSKREIIWVKSFHERVHDIHQQDCC